MNAARAALDAIWSLGLVIFGVMVGFTAEYVLELAARLVVL